MKILSYILCISCTLGTLSAMERPGERSGSPVLGNWLLAALNNTAVGNIALTQSKKTNRSLIKRIQVLEADNDTLNPLERRDALATLYGELRDTYQKESKLYKKYDREVKGHQDCALMLRTAQEAQQEIAKESERLQNISFLQEKIQRLRASNFDTEFQRCNSLLETMDSLLPLLIPNSAEYHEHKVLIEETENKLRIECFKRKITDEEKQKKDSATLCQSYEHFLTSSCKLDEAERAQYEAIHAQLLRKAKHEGFLRGIEADLQSIENTPYINEFYKLDDKARILQRKRTYLTNRQQEHPQELASCFKQLERIRHHQTTLTDNAQVKEQLLLSLK